MKEAMNLYRDAIGKAGITGSRKRWRLAAMALAKITDDADGQNAYFRAVESHKRADWRNAAQTLAKAVSGVKTGPSVDFIAKSTPRPVTLIEFLSQSGGLSDRGGDLAGMDADKWHRAAPFRRKLIQADGLSLDAAADLAFERGYFDDVAPAAWDDGSNMHPVTESALLEAIRRELAGRPRIPFAVERAADVAAYEPDESERAYFADAPQWQEAA